MKDFIEKDKKLNCYHCGEDCDVEVIQAFDKTFCCKGCKTVYEILSENQLCGYYDLQKQPGIKVSRNSSGKFAYLDSEEVIEQLIDYQDEKLVKVHFYLPQIHCSACLWLLENLYKINEEIIESRVNFLKKEVRITFYKKDLSLRQLVELLTSIGYEPTISLENASKNKPQQTDRRLIYQIGLAGFAFGNIMLLSLPEYFGLDTQSWKQFTPWFSWLNVLLATPVTVYSGQDYFRSAWVSIKQKRLNIDVPIALGISVLFTRSLYEIISQSGPGYLDSLCGLLFFLLLGRLFQQKIYHRLSFERDYRSYFPLSISKLVNNTEESVAINTLKKRDQILIRNGELIPVDALLIEGKARIDNSFATGESIPVEKQEGDKIYAGGRQVGEAITLEVLRSLDQSKLSRLWQEYASKEKSEATFSALTDKISSWFTPVILLIATTAALWFAYYESWGKALEVSSAILIVACPCALALAAPFSFGHAIRKLGRNNCYLRDASVMEKMAEIDSIVFDKTGTLTHNAHQQLLYFNSDHSEKLNGLNDYERVAFASLLAQSNHPLSRLILQQLQEVKRIKINHFEEIAGKGLIAVIEGKVYQLGSSEWLNFKVNNNTGTPVVLAFEKEVLGYFIVQHAYRAGLQNLVNELSRQYELSMISGDNDNQKSKLQQLFPVGSKLHFQQSPKDKLNFISHLKKEKKKVAMVGDGLNDAGALKKADVGISIADDLNAFAPACDIILHASQFDKIHRLFRFSRYSKKIVLWSFAISFLYNFIGLGFAVQGLLSPVFAAILMPISSITVVGFVSLAINLKRI